MLALVSCDKLFVGDRTGKPVTFSASSDVPAGTKTAYSGEVINGRERINWVDKDPVRMIMFTHGQWDRNPVETDAKTYYVVDIHEEGQKSVGKVASAGAFLTWRENLVHDFYSIYPGNYIGSTDIGYNREITLTLPSAQHGDVAANMRYAYMAAIHEGYTTAGKGSVVLDYYPMVTTVYITLNNTTQAPMTIRSVGLKSTIPNNPQSLVGTYTVSSSGGTSPFSPQSWSESATSSEVSVMLDNTTLQPGESTTCVIFLMPTKTYSTSDLQLTVVTSSGISNLSLQNSAVSQFEPCKKYNLSFNVAEQPIQYDDLTPVMSILLTLSDSPISHNFVYLNWKTPKGLYYNLDYKHGSSGDGYIPVSHEDIQAALQEVTDISNASDHELDWLLYDITPADLAIFPNLQSFSLSVSNSNKSFSVADLSNLIELMYAGTATSLSVTNCSFDPENAQPLVICANSQEMKNISLTNISGLHEIVLQGGENGGGGQIGNVFIQNCPDLKTIRIKKTSGDIVMKKAVFDNLASIETIYIERANFTTDIEVNDCPNLKRFIVCNQANWELQRVSVSNCPVLGNSAVDNSEFGVTGFNIEKVNENFMAWKYNCPDLGATFNTSNKYGATTITFRE